MDSNVIRARSPIRRTRSPAILLTKTTPTVAFADSKRRVPFSKGTPIGLFSPERNTAILNENSARRERSARKAKQLRQALAIVRSGRKEIPSVPRLTMEPPKALVLAPKTNESKSNSTVDTTPPKPKADAKAKIATPLATMLQGAFDKAEVDYPAELAEKDLTKRMEDLVIHENDTFADKENVGIPEQTTRNLANAFGECGSNVELEAESDSVSVPVKPVQVKKETGIKVLSGTPLNSRVMSRLDLVISNVHSQQQYGTIETRVNRTPVRRSLRIRRSAKKEK